MEPVSFSMAFGPVVLADEISGRSAVGQSCHCTSPGEIVWPMPMSDLATRTSTVAICGRRRGFDLRRLFRTAGQHGGNATSGDGDSQHN